MLVDVQVVIRAEHLLNASQKFYRWSRHILHGIIPRRSQCKSSDIGLRMTSCLGAYVWPYTGLLNATVFLTNENRMTHQLHR